jgi:hypothetical protein
MTDLHLAIEAAKLLGRWTLIAQVEGNVVAWLRHKHPLLENRASVTGLLKDCIARSQPAGAEVLQPLFSDLDEALAHLERTQHGFV